MNALYAYDMTLPQLALSSLAIGLVIGVGLSLLVVWAYRARARVQEETSLAIPPGITDVLHSMDDAAGVVDTSGLVLAASDAASRFGIEVGSTLDNPELRQLVRGVRTAGGTATESMRITRGGLSLDPRLVSARASAIGTRLVLLIIRDVTEQERLDQMRRDFVANTSHELKTPVGAVSLLAEAIESAADDPAQVRIFAARISAEAGRLGQLTGRIMSLSRLQAEDGLTKVGPVAIDEVIAASIEAHVVQADSAGVELARGGDRGVWVRGDAQILIEAVGNLIANAIVYSPRGSRVGVGVRAEDGVVEIAVSDQGIGIAEADRERIFERFYRADEARSRRTGGTGLGLSIVKHATQRHGGEVRLWSRPAEDPPSRSDSSDRCPRSRRHGQEEQEEACAQSGQGCGIRARSKRRESMTRILLVEDEPDLADPLAYLLRREGYEVEIAEDAPARSRLSGSGGADIVLLDLMLPGMPGTEVCRQIRSTSAVPIIMLTAKDSEVDIVVGLELGADDYITKPYSSRELLARMRAVLRRVVQADSELDERVLDGGRVSLDIDRHTVSVAGEQINMPLKEFELLEVLMRNSGRVLTRGQLIDRVWGSDYFGDTKTLDVHIKRIRSRIEENPSEPVMLVTVRGLGYRFEG